MNTPKSFAISRLTRYAIQGVVLGGLVTAVIVGWTVDADTFTHLRAFPAPMLLVLLAMAVLAWLCIGTRLWILTHSMGYRLRWRDSVAIGLSSEFGVAASPAGVGGAAVRMVFLHRAGLPLHDAFTVFAADSLLDVVFCAVLFPVTLLVIWKDPTWQDFFREQVRLGPLLAGLPLIALLAAAWIVLRRRTLDRFLERSLPRLPAAGRLRLRGRYRHLRHAIRRNLKLSVQGARFLLHARPSRLALCLSLAVVQWLARYGILPVILYTFGTTRNPIPLLMIQGLFFALALIIVLPGGGGGIELMTTALLRHFVPLSLVGVVVLMWRAFTYHLYLLVGGAVFSAIFHRRVGMQPVTGAQAARDAHGRAVAAAGLATADAGPPPDPQRRREEHAS